MLWMAMLVMMNEYEFGLDSMALGCGQAFCKHSIWIRTSMS